MSQRIILSADLKKGTFVRPLIWTLSYTSETYSERKYIQKHITIDSLSHARPGAPSSSRTANCPLITWHNNRQTNNCSALGSALDSSSSRLGLIDRDTQMWFNYCLETFNTRPISSASQPQLPVVLCAVDLSLLSTGVLNSLSVDLL